MLKQLDIIGRTSELAKLFGIQFYEVLSRGSQVSTHDYFEIYGCYYKYNDVNILHIL